MGPEMIAGLPKERILADRRIPLGSPPDSGSVGLERLM